MLRRAYWASAVYAGLGLASGLFYRELTRTHPGADPGQLGLAHTHFLVLGVFLGLSVLVLEKLFSISGSRFSRAFEVTWHLGVVITAAMMLVKGALSVLAVDFNEKMLAGISGLGHIILTAAFVLLFVTLGRSIHTTTAVEPAGVGA
ncbi:DUF2871 domain-containing protein [Tessaracoccus sp. OS52]|uniref:DUF2871 domain-containing protein n=1 Tax=Tessaracoccus sp. OS52 TaxID=2886691 RepID=UPI001D114306|nr:DUF2871 domain-containing protein [Tessaracoccus sp. OS52]MCC2593947.1 DUF2871 domain-containing protein [Tessaracoccus sp. OS52]